MATRIVDSREPAYIRDKLILSGWRMTALKTGDYMFRNYDGTYTGITRKTVPDLLTSMVTNFGIQLEEMMRRYNHFIILIEGEMKATPPKYKIIAPTGISRYTWDMCWNFLRTWQDRGYTIERTIDNDHTVQRLNSLYAYYQKPAHFGGIKQEEKHR